MIRALAPHALHDDAFTLDHYTLTARIYHPIEDQTFTELRHPHVDLT